jgi:carbamoyl-phosphate synthase small subunit
VQDRETGKVEVTAHNHGFAVDAPTEGRFETPYGAAEVSHVCLNDGVVEGLRCRDVPAFSVQYHPEAAAGPHDAAYLFERFTDLLEGQRPPSQSIMQRGTGSGPPLHDRRGSGPATDGGS